MIKRYNAIKEDQVINATLDKKKVQNFKNDIINEYEAQKQLFENTTLNVDIGYITQSPGGMIKGGFRLLSDSHKKALMHNYTEYKTSFIFTNGQEIGIKMWGALDERLMKSIYKETKLVEDIDILAIIQKFNIKNPHLLVSSQSMAYLSQKFSNNFIRDLNTGNGILKLGEYEIVCIFAGGTGDTAYLYDGSQNLGTLNILTDKNDKYVIQEGAGKGLHIAIRNPTEDKDILEEWNKEKWIVEKYPDKQERENYIKSSISIQVSMTLKFEKNPDIEIYKIKGIKDKED